MEERHEFIETMQRAVAKLQVKASLAKLELGHVKDELIAEYDKLHDKLREMREETEDEWYATKGGFLSSWEAFKDRFHEATKKSS